MGRVILTLPRLGETMEEAKVVEWLVAPGTAFQRGDVLLEVETDKTVVEVPALTAGMLMAQLVAPGDTVALDQPIAEVEVAGEHPATPPPQAPDAQRASPPPRGEGMGAGGLTVVAAPPASTGGRPMASPAARAAARRGGVDLTAVQGSGRRGRVTAADVAGTTAGHGAGGETLVLLHGLFDDARGWRDLPARLARAGHRVLAPDLPGHAAGLPPATSLDDAVAQIIATLPPGPIRLIGHSLGAVLAVRVALAIGARATGLILSAPAGLGPRINADFIDGMLAAQTTAALSQALSLLDAGPLSTTALTAELARLQSLRPGHAALAAGLSTKGFQQTDITADLARLTCPVSVIFGTADRILDWHDIARLPQDVAIHLVRGAGHLPHLAATELVLRLAAQDHAPQRRRAQA